MSVNILEYIDSISQYENDQKNREYEVKVSNFSKSLESADIEAFVKYADDENNNLFARKSCFFAVFTYYRKNYMLKSMSKIVEHFKNVDGFDFDEDPLLYHIALLHDGKWIGLDDYGKLIKTFENKLLVQEEKADYEDFLGFLNHYVEVVASYYEMNLEKRLNEEKNETEERLKRAYEYSKLCCSRDRKYAKLFVNKGRILVLLGKYADGESAIRQGISLIENDDKHHDKNLVAFTAYLDKIATVISFDKSFKIMQECTDKQKQLEDNVKKSKIENIRNLSIISSLLSFILVGIQAFEKISDYKVIGLVMLMYTGLVIAVIGIINLIASFATIKAKEKPVPYLFSLLLLIVGVGLFLLGIMLKV